MFYQTNLRRTFVCLQLLGPLQHAHLCATQKTDLGATPQPFVAQAPTPVNPLFHTKKDKKRSIVQQPTDRSSYYKNLMIACPFEDCNKSYKKKYHLDRHKKAVHSGQRFWCDVPGCFKSFAYPANWRRHRKTHQSGWQPPRFACAYPGCSKNYSTKAGLRVHKERDHQGRVFPCDTPGCGKVFKNRCSLKKHKESYLGKEFFCPEISCNKIYRSQEGLRKHIQAKHKEAFN